VSCSSAAVPVSPIAFAAVIGSTNDSGRTRNQAFDVVKQRMQGSLLAKAAAVVRII
jgi:hypothetical protein